MNFFFFLFLFLFSIDLFQSVKKRWFVLTKTALRYYETDKVAFSFLFFSFSFSFFFFFFFFFFFWSTPFSFFLFLFLFLFLLLSLQQLGKALGVIFLRGVTGVHKSEGQKSGASFEIVTPERVYVISGAEVDSWVESVARLIPSDAQREDAQKVLKSGYLTKQGGGFKVGICEL